MLSIAVCDDEIRECFIIASQIQTLLDTLHVPCTIRQYHDGETLLKANEQFDMIFLDIIMPGLNGMEVARKLRANACDRLLIFITSDRLSVYDSFAVEAFDYLVKPVDPARLSQVLQRAVAKMRERSEDFIIVSKERRTTKLFLNDIRYFEIYGRLIEAHGQNSLGTWYEQIGSLEKRLRDKAFFRCHKSYLVNLKYVDTYTRQEAVLDTGQKIPVAKRRYDAFCTAMLTHMRENERSIP